MRRAFKGRRGAVAKVPVIRERTGAAGAIDKLHLYGSLAISASGICKTGLHTGSNPDILSLTSRLSATMIGCHLQRYREISGITVSMPRVGKGGYITIAEIPFPLEL